MPTTYPSAEPADVHLMVAVVDVTFGVKTVNEAGAVPPFSEVSS
jgi:hypothetical protein